MFARRSPNSLVSLVFVVATIAACSTPNPKPGSTQQGQQGDESSGPGQQQAQQSEPAQKSEAAAQQAPESGEFACAQDPAPIGSVKVEAPYGEVHPETPPLRFDLPDGLAGLEPPKEAGQPVGQPGEGGTCEKPIYSTESQSLLSRGRAFSRCCEGAPKDADFVVGCMVARSCTLDVPTVKGVQSVRTLEELREAVAPIETVAEAVGMAAVYDRQVWVPYGSDVEARVAKINKWFKWFPLQEEPVAVQAEEHPWGWVLRLPAYRDCGCQHHLYRVAYRVTHDGQVCRLAEKPEAVAYAQTSICID